MNDYNCLTKPYEYDYFVNPNLFTYEDVENIISEIINNETEKQYCIIIDTFKQ